MSTLQSLIDRYSRGPSVLAYAVEGLAQEHAQARPGPGVWSIAELAAPPGRQRHGGQRPDEAGDRRGRPDPDAVRRGGLDQPAGRRTTRRSPIRWRSSPPIDVGPSASSVSAPRPISRERAGTPSRGGSPWPSSWSCTSTTSTTISVFCTRSGRTSELRCNRVILIPSSESVADEPPVRRNPMGPSAGLRPLR